MAEEFRRRHGWQLVIQLKVETNTDSIFLQWQRKFNLPQELFIQFYIAIIFSVAVSSPFCAYITALCRFVSLSIDSHWQLSYYVHVYLAENMTLLPALIPLWHQAWTSRLVNLQKYHYITDALMPCGLPPQNQIITQKQLYVLVFRS